MPPAPSGSESTANRPKFTHPATNPVARTGEFVSSSTVTVVGTFFCNGCLAPQSSMPVKPPVHKKVVVDHSAIDRVAFADWYRFGSGTEHATPLVIYFGGSISTGRAYPDFRSRIQTFVLEELLRRTPNPEPRHVAMLGNSAGAHIAAMLAFELERVRALATIGAVGLVEAANESDLRLFAGKRYKSFASEDDPCSTYTHQFWEAMISRGIAIDVIERDGSHAFEDYVANGSVHDAFAWLLAELSRCA